MKLNAPKRVTWWIAVVLGVLGIVGEYVPLGIISDNAFLFVAIGFVLLALATFIKGL